MDKDRMEKIERGVMVMKNGKAWGVEYEDGYCTAHSWIDPTDAPIHDPRFLRRPEDLAHESHTFDREELSTGKIIHVERKTTVSILIEKE